MFPTQAVLAGAGVEIELEPSDILLYSLSMDKISAFSDSDKNKVIIL
ncbi:hypothetical protein GCM10023142_03750 [Anaerocolumna aminovalerica]